MKSHISVTIDRDLLEQLDRFGREECCNLSQIIEMALERFLQQRGERDDAILNSPGHFEGRFSQEETYERG